MNGRRTLLPRMTPWLFLLPFLATTTVFVLWPLLRSLPLSLQQTYGPQTAVWVGPHNYRALLSDPLFWTALRNTAVFALASLFIQLPLSLGLALALHRLRSRLGAFLKLVYFSPSLVGTVFVGLMFSLLFEKRTGLVNQALHTLLPAFPLEFAWLETHVMGALVVAALWLYVGFNMIFFLAALQHVPSDLMEAAELEGASAWQGFRHVIWPQLRPVTSFVVLTSLLGSFQLFELPLALLRGPGPNNSGLTVVMYLYQTGFLTADLGYASAIGWVLALILISLAVLQRRYAGRHES
jgi:ABC-type sugar transport system permease subunit